MVELSSLSCAELGCDKPVHSRALCMAHYTKHRRAGTLDEWPTQPFLDDPEKYIRWAFVFEPDLIDRVARAYGKRVVVGRDD